MKLIIILFGVFLIFAGLFLLVDPNILINMIEENRESRSLYLGAIIMRLVIGLLLLKLANESRFPTVFKVIGLIFVIAAVALTVMSHGGFQEFVSAVIPVVKPYGRVVGVAAMAMGFFLVYGLSSKKQVEFK